jgi:FlaG/FlaF family flagellin (archaellin)
MVAITVILAAVIAAFVLGLGDTSDPGPQVSFDYNFDEDNGTNPGTLDITVSSGDSFEAQLITFEGTGFDSPGQRFNEADADNKLQPGSVVRAGERAQLVGVDTDFELDITFTSEDGQDSSIIATRTGPDA